MPPSPLRPARPAAALLAAALLGACAHRRPVAPPAPAALAASTAAAPRAATRPPTRPPTRVARRSAAPADATSAPRTGPAGGAGQFAHAPGVTWDLEVLPFEGHARVQHYVGVFTGPARDRFGAWLSRGSRYEPMVRARLREGGLPEDLYYLALVESGYDVHAVSRVGAGGMWQFMPQTARDLGLRLDWWVDDRRDPVRATDAAVRMLRDLRRQFGSLYVAAAAYNGGPGRVARGVAFVRAGEGAAAASGAADSAAAAVLTALGGAPNGAPNGALSGAPVATAAPAAPADAAPPAALPDGGRGGWGPPPPNAAARAAAATGEARFFALADAGMIAAETRNYVPQLIAAALVAKEPDRHGVTVRAAEPFAYDEVEVPGLTPLAAVADASGASRAELLDLNPHLLRGVTPPGAMYWVRVPAGRADATAAALDAMDDERFVAFRRAATRKRETYAGLADRLGVSEALVRLYNPRLEVVRKGRHRGRLVASQAVRVPTGAVLAYARATPAYGLPSGLAPLPAPPPEPEPKAAKAAKAEKPAKTAKSAEKAAKAPGKAPAKSAVKSAAKAGAGKEPRARRRAE